MRDSTIFSTRRGFRLQDLVCAYKYVSEFQSKRLGMLFADYPLPGQKSLDVRFISQRNAEEITEVKSGEQFMLDKRKKASSEIRDAFIGLKQYSDSNVDVKMSLIVSSDLWLKIPFYWACLCDIRDAQSWRTPAAKSAAGWLHQKLRLTGINNPFEMFELSKKISINPTHQDLQDNENDFYSDLEDLIISKINDLSRAPFSAPSASDELGPDYLLFELLYLCAKHAGTGQDLVPHMNESIVRFFARRKMIHSYGRPAGSDMIAAEDVERRVLKQWLSNQEVVPAISILENI